MNVISNEKRDLQEGGVRHHQSLQREGSLAGRSYGADFQAAARAEIQAPKSDLKSPTNDRV